MSANLRHEGAALAAMGQELAGLIDIAPRIELDHLDIETGHGRGQSARDFHRLRQRHRALPCSDPQAITHYERSLVIAHPAGSYRMPSRRSDRRRVGVARHQRA